MAGAIGRAWPIAKGAYDLRVLGRPRTVAPKTLRKALAILSPSPHSDLSMFQKIGVAGPSSTPVSDFRHALGRVNCPSGT
jgi:hypothetical protein